MAYKLATANQISIWLENKKGFDKYTKQYPNNPGYFLHFTSVDSGSEEFADLEEGLDYLKAKIDGLNPKKEYGFSIVQKVPGGKAGAAYLYPDPTLQNDTEIAALKSNLIAFAQEWADENGGTMTVVPDSEIGTDKYLIIAIAL